MLLSDKRVRNIIREEILKKSRNRRRMNEASADPERRWKKITSMLGVSEKPSKSQYNRAWDRFIENHYKRMKEEQPKVSELFSDKDVSAALSKFGGAYDTDDEEEKIFMFLIKYKNVQGRSTGGMKKKEKEEAGEEEETETVESSETIDLGQGANWDNAVKLNVDEGGRVILDDQFTNLVDGVVDSLDGSVSLQNVKDVTNVIKKLKDKKVVNPVSENEVDALKWLHKKYKAAEGGDTIDGDVKDLLDDEDLQDHAEYITKHFASRTLSESRSSKSKTRAVIQELVKRHIRQLNEDQPASVQDRFSTAKVVDAVPAGAGGGKWKKGAKIRAVWMKKPSNPAVAPGDGKKYNAMVSSIDGGGKYTVTWEDGGKIQKGTPEAMISRRSSRSGGGGGSSYTTFDPKKDWPMKKRHKGDMVQKLQQALQATTPGLKDDKYFGSLTAAALKKDSRGNQDEEVKDQKEYDAIIKSEPDPKDKVRHSGEGVHTPTEPEKPGGDPGTGKDKKKEKRRTKAGVYKIKRKDFAKTEGNDIVINPTKGMEGKMKQWMQNYFRAIVAKDPSQKPVPKLKDIKQPDLIYIKNYPIGKTITADEFMKASVSIKGDFMGMKLPGQGADISKKMKKALWYAMIQAEIVEPAQEEE